MWISLRSAEILGVGAERAPTTASALIRLVSAEDPDAGRKELIRRLVEDGVYDQVGYAPASGRWFRLQGRALKDEAGDLLSASGSIEDVTEAKISTETDNAILNSLSQGIAVVDRWGDISKVNGTWPGFPLGAQIEGMEVGIGCNYLEVCRRAARAGCAEAAKMLQGLADVMERRKESFEMEYKWAPPNGPQRYFSVTVTPFRGAMEGALISHDDVTDRKRLEGQLRVQASTDHLTSLPNRRSMLDKLAELHSSYRLDGFALVIIDIGDFQTVNGVWGQRVGDRVQVRLAETLSGIAGGHFLARSGSNEFAMVLTSEGDQDLKGLAESKGHRIIEALRQPFHFPGLEERIRIRGSVGVSFSSADVTVDALVRGACLAVQVSKNEGGGRVVFDDIPDISEQLQRLSLLNEVDDALERERLCLHYQPIVSAESFAPHGAEALLRWMRPDGSIVSAGRFLPALAGTSGEIELDRWVIRQACRQWSLWQSHAEGGLPLEVLTINVCYRTLALPDFCDWFGETLAEFKVKGSDFALEITAGARVQDPNLISAVCRRIASKHGSQFWLDDVGSVHSTMQWLCDMPGSIAKVDPSYLRKFSDTAVKRRVAQSLVRLVQALGGKIVAESLQDRLDVDIWREAECDLLQGYYFAKPQSAEQFGAWLSKRMDIAV